MDTITNMIAVPLGYAMEFCYSFLKNYGLAIILFTIFTKIISCIKGYTKMACLPSDCAVNRFV